MSWVSPLATRSSIASSIVGSWIPEPGSTVNGALVAPAARFPARSLAVPAAIVIPSVPLPEIAEIVTVRTLPAPETDRVPVAVPVELSVTSGTSRVTVFAPV